MEGHVREDVRNKAEHGFCMCCSPAAGSGGEGGGVFAPSKLGGVATPFFSDAAAIGAC